MNDIREVQVYSNRLRRFGFAHVSCFGSLLLGVRGPNHFCTGLVWLTFRISSSKALIYPPRTVILSGTNRASLNPDGKLLGNDDYQPRFEALIEGFVKFVHALRS